MDDFYCKICYINTEELIVKCSSCQYNTCTECSKTWTPKEKTCPRCNEILDQYNVPIQCDTCYEDTTEYLSNKCEVCNYKMCIKCSNKWNLNKDTCPQCRSHFNPEVRQLYGKPKPKGSFPMDMFADGSPMDKFATGYMLIRMFHITHPSLLDRLEEAFNISPYEDDDND